MKRTLISFLVIIASIHYTFSQNFGNFPKIKKEMLLNDLELLYQGLDKFHSGMYWYTSKDSVDTAFAEARKEIDQDLNVFEFYNIVAPLAGLSREDHTDVFLPKSVREKMYKEARLFPLSVVFLGKKMYCVRNGSDFDDISLEGKEIESINGESPEEIVNKIGNLLISDGYIKTVKYSDLEGFNFSVYYFYFHGEQQEFKIKYEGVERPIRIRPLILKEINQNHRKRYKRVKTKKQKDLLEFKLLKNSTAYLGVHSFSNDDIKKESKEKNLKTFLKNSFESVKVNEIETLIIDVSKNSGGTEGNEGLLYSYFGDNYQKYKKVRAKTQKAILDNGVDKPIKLKAFGLIQRIFVNKKMKDGSMERREGIGYGLMAYKKEPEYKFKGKVYVIIGPETYSGGSEFSNMMYTQDLATFVGQETGGGYYGNTSGYSEELVLPNSKIQIDIPALQFVMNVEPTLPFGRGVIPHHEVIPTFEEYANGDNASIEYIMNILEK